MKIIHIFLIFVFVFSNTNITEIEVHARSKKDLHYFYGKECPGCVYALPIVEKLSKKYGLKLLKYEVWHNTLNRIILLKMSKKINKKAPGVPIVIIGNDMYFGVDKILTIERNIRKYL